MSKINVRSPYHINLTEANLTSAILDLYVYTGTQTTSRGSIDYTINSTAINDEITFEISELVRDFLDVTFSGTYTSQMVWVDYQITRTVNSVPQTPESFVQLDGFDGYGYFEDLVNPQLSSPLMQSNTLVYVLDGQDFNVPVSNDLTDTVEFYDGGILVRTETITPSSLSSGQIEYFASGSGSTYESRVLADGGTFEDSTCLQAVLSELGIDGNIDTIIVTPLAGDPITITLETVEECKYTPYKLTFINKFGVLQDIWFFKRSNLNLNTNDTKYKADILSSGSYSASEHRYKILTKQGKENLTLNSGFVDEQFNEVFRQFMLSEKVWISYQGQTLPVNVLNGQLGFKTSLNDNTINYTIDIEFAFDKINNIR